MKNSIISGGYDLHVHPAPDLLPRKFDDFDLAQHIIDSGMAGFAIKSHYFCTADRAKLVNKAYPDCHAFGMIWLNNAVGGINPIAVEMAARAGTKFVGFPTVDTVSGINKVFTLPPEKRPFWARVIVSMREEGIEPKPVVVTRDGKLVPEAYDVLDTVAKYDMILATGHLLPDECLILTKAAHERGVKRIVCTHVSAASSGYSTDYQKEMLKYGAFMEHTTQSWSSGKVAFEKIAAQIKEIGIDRCIFSTDLGQPKNRFPEEDLLDFCTKLVEDGWFTEDEVHHAVAENTRYLVND